MKRPKEFLTCLVFLAQLSPNNLQQVEPPNPYNEPYNPPELGRGLGTVDNSNDVIPNSNGRRYPDRSQSFNDPARDFRNSGSGNYFQTPPGGERDQNQQNKYPDLKSFAYEPFPTNNNSRSNVIVTRRTTLPPRTTSERVTAGPVGKPTRSPFDDPNRYRVPQIQQESDNPRFVNGRPYKENPNIQDRYGNRYDPRFHSIPGQYDPENDPRFSDPRYQDPRNVPKYNNNRQRLPQDRKSTRLNSITSRSRMPSSA